MITAVVDSNVIVSSAVSERTPPERIMTSWNTELFRLAISAPMIDEVARTLEKPYFVHHADRQRIEDVLTSLREHAILVPITARVSGVATDPEDDVVIATALSARAEYLVTGDLQLQRLGQYRGVRIVSPAVFLGVLEGSVAESER